MNAEVKERILLNLSKAQNALQKGDAIAATEFINNAIKDIKPLPGTGTNGGIK